MLRPIILMTAALALTSQTGCNMVALTTNTTAKVLVRAQPAMEQESDYDLARAAMPATLKTVEGFHIANPANKTLVGMLAKGYCQYGSGFVDDAWEAAVLAGHDKRAAHLSNRATKIYVRCMNYGLEMLGGKWKKSIFGTIDAVKRLAAAAGPGDRDGMMWTAIGLASAINHNRDNITMVSQMPKAKILLERVVALDQQTAPKDPMMRALPHLALGMLDTFAGKAMGGRPDLGKKEFMRALQVTGGKFLLAKVFYARYYGVITQNKKLFEDNLVQVLRTDPAIWPQQRLANEIAHRKARRYLKNEKEWF